MLGGANNSVPHEVGHIAHFRSSFFFVPPAPAQQLNKFLSHLLAPLHPRLYISISIASHHAPGILSLRRRGSRRAFAPCRSHWQQRQLGRPLQRGGGPRAEVFGQPIRKHRYPHLAALFCSFWSHRISTKAGKAFTDIKHIFLSKC